MSALTQKGFEYSPYRATLYRDGVFFALVCDDKLEALDPAKVEEMIALLGDRLHPEASALREESAWGDHEEYPREDWQYEVAGTGTNQGYFEWLSIKLWDAEDEAAEE